MIKINLLSPDDKSSAKWEKINRMIISSATAVIIMQLVFVLFIFISIEYLKTENNSLNTQLENLQTKSEAKEIREMENAIDNYGDRLKCINKIQKDHSYWVQIFEKFSKLIPDSVKIEKLSVKEKDDSEEESRLKSKLGDDEKYIVNIKGIAKKRKDLLEFENNLKNSEVFDLIIFGDYMENNYKEEVNANFEYDMLINKSAVLISN